MKMTNKISMTDEEYVNDYRKAVLEFRFKKTVRVEKKVVKAHDISQRLLGPAQMKLQTEMKKYGTNNI